MLNTLKYVVNHPMNKGQTLKAVSIFFGWQLGSRIIKDHTHEWIEGTKLIVNNGMTGATGNIYCGLHEFADMGFFLHALREDDLFLDIGTNIGSYTVLASGVCGAEAICFEPDPITAAHLKRNINVNNLSDRVKVYNVALGSRDGEVSFTIGLDTVNQVSTDDTLQTRTVPLRKLDNINRAKDAQFIKMDVEGYEAEVLSGADDVLNSKKLIAIETEAQDTHVMERIKNAGFEQYYYNPVKRELSKTPFADIHASNALLIKNYEFVLGRVQSAPRRKIHGKIV